MADKPESADQTLLFTQLIMSFHAAAWQQLGKIASPLTGKVDRNMELAKNSIDILGMLEAKTRGNLGEDEERLLRQILTQLRLNYVEELKKPPAGPTPEKAAGETGESKADDRAPEGANGQAT
jgi:hypothetical protein